MSGWADTFDKVKALAEKGKVKSPVLWDKGEKNRTAYGIRDYPKFYLIGTDGKVLWEAFSAVFGKDPEKKTEKTLEFEKTLEAELQKVKK